MRARIFLAAVLLAAASCEGTLIGPNPGDAARDSRPDGAVDGAALDAPDLGPRDGPALENPPGIPDGLRPDRGDAASLPPDRSASPDKAPPSCPAGHKRINGVCVPSCGTAGGNTCTSSTTNLCLGLPQLKSYDCAVCCKVKKRLEALGYVGD